MIIGLTGSLATGKTTVARLLKKRGAYVIDADKLVHRLLGSPERKILSGFIFDDRQALRRLCSLIHPIVKKEIIARVNKNKAKKIIVIDAPLLIEAGLHKKCQVIIVVKARQAVQIMRASKNLRISKNECLKRIRQQLPLRKKIAIADFVIDNNGSIKNTEKQTEKLWTELSRKSR